MNKFKRLLGYMLIAVALVVSGGCQKKEAVKPPAPKPVEKEVSVIGKMEDEQAKMLISDVRDYAEAFDIGAIDKDVRKLIKTGIASGSKSGDIRDKASEIIEPYLIEAIKARIEESLTDKVGKATKEDVEDVLSYVDVDQLMNFIVDYEIERLKMEGYLR